MTKRPIYLDYMATTPVDPRVIDVMVNYLSYCGVFGNSASKTHSYGQDAAIAIETARQTLAETLNTTSDSLVFTSGATEANNLAILGAARFYCRKGKHVITMVTEHKAVLDSFSQLEQEGFTVTYLKPNPDGLLDLDQLKAALRPDTILVSIMHVNNEIGVVQDIKAIGDYLHGKGIIFHVDAAQSAGKLTIDLSRLPVHLMSFSAHKNYGPKGIGALYIQQKPRIRLSPITYGGGQENGMRAGTLPTHQIVAMAQAFAISHSEMLEEQRRISALRNRLWQGIKTIPGLYPNGHPENRIAGILNFSVAEVGGEALFVGLSELALSSTSACASASFQPSYVLKALGVPDSLCYSSIRLSIGRFTTDNDIDQTIKIINQKIPYLRAQSL